MHNASTLMMDTTVLVAVATQETELHVTVCFSIFIATVVTFIMRVNKINIVCRYQ